MLCGYHVESKELVAPSVAAPGMMCGERQLAELKSRLVDRFVQTLERRNISKRLTYGMRFDEETHHSILP